MWSCEGFASLGPCPGEVAAVLPFLITDPFTCHHGPLASVGGGFITPWLSWEVGPSIVTLGMNCQAIVLYSKLLLCHGARQRVSPIVVARRPPGPEAVFSPSVFCAEGTFSFSSTECTEQIKVDTPFPPITFTVQLQTGALTLGKMLPSNPSASTTSVHLLPFIAFLCGDDS